MFDQEKMTQTVVNLAKDFTTANLTVMKTSMEQFEKTVHILTRQGAVAQDEGAKLLVDWWSRAKQGQEQYYNLMQDGFKNMEKLLGNTDPVKKNHK